MRGFWRVIALIAEDANSFNDILASIADQVTNPNLRNGVALNTAAPRISLDLELQPTPSILLNIDSYLRSVDKTLILTAYELAEVNRIACEAKTNEVPPTGASRLTGRDLELSRLGIEAVRASWRLSEDWRLTIGRARSSRQDIWT